MVSKAELGELYQMTDAQFTAWQDELNRSSRNKLVGESGFRGVCRFRNKWKAETRHGGRFVFIGTFESKHEAARAYDRFVLAHRGRKALLTFHPRNYVTPEGDLLPAEKPSGASPSTSATDCTTALDPGPSNTARTKPKARRVRVWWLVGDGGKYFEGTVTDQRAAQNGGQELFIEYDDGDKMWHSTNETRIVEIATEDAPEVSPSARSEHAPQLND